MNENWGYRISCQSWRRVSMTEMWEMKVHLKIFLLGNPLTFFLSVTCPLESSWLIAVIRNVSQYTKRKKKKITKRKTLKIIPLSNSYLTLQIFPKEFAKNPHDLTTDKLSDTAHCFSTQIELFFDPARKTHLKHAHLSFKEKEDRGRDRNVYSLQVFTQSTRFEFLSLSVCLSPCRTIKLSFRPTFVPLSHSVKIRAQGWKNLGEGFHNQHELQ